MPTPTWPQLIAQHGALVWSLCRRLDPEPEDAAQEVWEKIGRFLDRFDPGDPRPRSAWILAVAHRHLVDRHRRRLVRGPVTAEETELPDPRPAPDSAMDLERALALLPADQRRVVVLHHVHGVSLEEIAAQEGVALGTVKSRLHRARARLVLSLGGST